MRKFLLQSLLLTSIILACVLLCQPAHAAPADALRLYAGANAAWLDGPGSEFPVDVEASGNASASLSPHLSLVADLAYGFSHSYLRWDGGARATVTDVANPDFNMYLGIRYRGGSTSAVQPSEWAPDAGVGWKPSPERWPNLILGADASYGLTSARSLSYLAIRYMLPVSLFH